MDTDSWLEWNGGENPAPGRMVEARLRGGEKVTLHPTETDWEILGTDSDIISYRVIGDSE